MRALFFILLFSSSYAQINGNLDSSFGTDGVFITPLISSQRNSTGDAIQLSDNKIIAAGGLGGFSLSSLLVRYLPTGEIDTSFNTNSLTALFSSVTYSYIGCIGRQSDGKLIIAGLMGQNPSNPYIARIDQDGTIDTSFGNAGIMTVSNTTFTEFTSLLILPDDKIIIVGNGDSVPNNVDIKAVKFDEDGSLDTSFGDNGIATIEYGNYLQKARAAILNGNKILIVGYSSFPNHNNGSLITQLNSDGNLDDGFGNDGYIEIPFGNYIGVNDNDIFRTVQISNNKIIVVGSYTPDYINYNISIARFSMNGDLDLTFGNDGKLLIDGPGTREHISDLQILNDGDLLLGGRIYDTVSTYDSLLMRLNPDGTYEENFGNNGIVITSIANNSEIDKLIVNQDHIITVGNTIIGNTPTGGLSPIRITLAKYSNNNTLATQNQIDNKKITLLPNPVQHELHIDNPAGRKIDRITIINFTGALVYESKDVIHESFDFNSFTSGLYIVKIESEGKQENHKIMKY